MNSGDNSHLVVVPAGSVLSDNLYNTPLFQGEGHGFGGGAEAGGGGDAEVNLPASFASSLLQYDTRGLILQPSHSIIALFE